MHCNVFPANMPSTFLLSSRPVDSCVKECLNPSGDRSTMNRSECASTGIEVNNLLTTNNVAQRGTRRVLTAVNEMSLSAERFSGRDSTLQIEYGIGTGTGVSTGMYDKQEVNLKDKTTTQRQSPPSVQLDPRICGYCANQMR